MTVVAKTYPAGEITPMGARRLLAGDEPMFAYRSFNDKIAWHISGPMEPMPGVQNGALLPEGTKGLIPTWQTQDQSGANIDGVIFNGSVLDPIVLDMVVELHGNTPAEAREVIRDWLASWSRNKTGELSAFTPDGGFWWAQARWLKSPTNALMAAASCHQRFNWAARIDRGCWRSFDSVSMWAPSYRDDEDLFGVDHVTGMGPGWEVDYRGTAGGDVYVDDGELRWRDDPDDVIWSNEREMVARRVGLATVTNNQVWEMEYGSIPEFTLGSFAANDLWGRMPAGGVPGHTGIRLRVRRGRVTLSAFVNGVEKILDQVIMLVPPGRRDKFTLVCGYEGNERRFRVMRERFKLIDTVDSGNFSALGPDYRGGGIGMHAGSAFITQATPGRIRGWWGGDNSAASQSGQVLVTNIGDQDEHPRFTVWGPGTWYFGNGPDATKLIKFGPLKDGQVVQIHTDDIQRGVVDFSDIKPTDDQLAELNTSIAELQTLAANGDVTKLLSLFESAFGMVPPQGELYRLLDGRFSKQIPAKEPGMPAVETPIVVKLEGGNVNSKVVAALTPRRVWPL